MSGPDPLRIFISYSRRDGYLVFPVVRLLRATHDLVFQDQDTLQPGKRWRPQVEQAIDASHLVAVFWCRHSRDSKHVSREYERAIAHERDVMPILLDSTPLPDSLGAFHGIDFRALAESAHDTPPVYRKMAKSLGEDYSWVVPLVENLRGELLRRRGAMIPRGVHPPD